MKHVCAEAASKREGIKMELPQNVLGMVLVVTRGSPPCEPLLSSLHGFSVFEKNQSWSAVHSALPRATPGSVCRKQATGVGTSRAGPTQRPWSLSAALRSTGFRSRNFPVFWALGLFETEKVKCCPASLFSIQRHVTLDNGRILHFADLRIHKYDEGGRAVLLRI